jgi:class 3 adenylate cyclase
MAASTRIVDISQDDVAVRRQRRRALLRIGVPILGVVLVIAAIIAIALYSHTANRSGVLALSDDLLNHLDAQIAQRVAAYLDPPERTLRIMRSVATGEPPTGRRATAERFAISTLKVLPQIAAFYIGDGRGDFLMVRRVENGVETKQIVNDPGARRVFLIDKTMDGVETARREDPADPYDPRTRPWYQGALTTDDVFWTGIYIFFSDRKPGITVSARVPDQDGTERVIGVDVRLEELSRFLASLEIGQHGRALIMDGEGRLIAAPDSDRLIKTVGDEMVTPKVDEIGDPIMTAAYDRFRVEGQGRRIIEHEGTRYVSSATHMPGSGRDWWILITVPEDDFIGFVASNGRTALTMSTVIVLAVMALAFLLVRQGIRSDRSLRAMAKRERLMARQSAAYTEIAQQVGQSDGEAPPALTETLVELTNARRASLWRFASGKRILHCVDSCIRGEEGHAGGFELHHRELSSFFALLESGEQVSIADAGADRRTAQFHVMIMRPLGSRALTIVPVQRGEQAIGAILLEDHGPLHNLQDLLSTAAAIFGSTVKPDAQDASPEATPARQVRDRATAVQPAPVLAADFSPTVEDRAKLRSEHFGELAVMALSLSGALALAKKCGATDVGMAAQITEILQESAAEHEVKYLKLMGQEAIAAAGTDEGADEATARIAAMAITVRERLSHLIETTGHGAEFRIGLAFGSGYGCLLGREQQQFNLWGNACETAAIMAQSAAPGAIQADAGVYARLRQDYLFRPRGSFYSPGIGYSRTFVLAGQL